MKRTLALLVGIAFLLAMSTLLLAQDVKKEEPKKPEPAPLHKKTKGFVSEITDTSLKITHKVAGKEETMEFVLEKPEKGIAVGDRVKVLYDEKDGKNIAVNVHKIEKLTPPPANEPKPEPPVK
jgi:hypothetical protein